MSTTEFDENVVDENVDESTEVADAEAQAPAADVAPVVFQDLRPLREKLKLSRTVVANKVNTIPGGADITVAKLYRIETGGKRTTDAETRIVRTALHQLEREAAETAAAQAAAVPAAPADGGVLPDPS